MDTKSWLKGIAIEIIGEYIKPYLPQIVGGIVISGGWLLAYFKNADISIYGLYAIGGVLIYLLWVDIRLRKNTLFLPPPAKDAREEIKSANVSQGIQSLEWTGGRGEVIAVLPAGSAPASATTAIPSTIGWHQLQNGAIKVHIIPVTTPPNSDTQGSST